LALLIFSVLILALIVLMLALPMGIWLTASFHGRVVLSARINFFFGLFSWRLQGGRAGRSGQAGQAESEESPDGIFRVVEAVRVKGLGHRVWLLGKQVSQRVKVQSIQSDLQVSLGDDYYTGMLAGILIPLVLYFNRMFNGAVMIRPAFDEDLYLEGDISGNLRVRPIEVLVPCLAFTLSPEFRQARRAMAGGPCKRK
jgi:hypothetical protein